MNKPVAKLTDQNGNTLNLLAICVRALKKSGNYHQIDELRDKVLNSKSQSEAIGHMGTYCDLR